MINKVYCIGGRCKQWKGGKSLALTDGVNICFPIDWFCLPIFQSFLKGLWFWHLTNFCKVLWWLKAEGSQPCKAVAICLINFTPVLSAREPVLTEGILSCRSHTGLQLKLYKHTYTQPLINNNIILKHGLKNKLIFLIHKFS